MNRIVSRTNDKIKFAVKLSLSAAMRKKEGLFLLEGPKLCFEAVLSGIPVVEAYITNQAFEKYKNELSLIIEKTDDVFEISQEVSDKLASTKTPQGVFCLCKILDKQTSIDKIDKNGIYIVLESLQNPLNFGAIARTAEALGINGIISSGGCDRYNPKALRASMGALFRLPVLEPNSLLGFLADCRKAGMSVLGAVPHMDAIPITDIKNKKGSICVIGNEGNGISQDLINICTDRVTVPMAGRAESLNASSAATIIMWEMVR